MYTVQRRSGEDEKNLGVDKFLSVLQEVRDPDPEHSDVALRHESGWCLSYFHGGLMVFENVEEGARDEIVHADAVSEIRALELWQHLATGDIEWVRNQEWLPGYG